ncbi:MAG: hypothetical protein ACXVEE_35000 [Polyangiales bacterium]
MLEKYLAAVTPTIGPRHVSTWRSKYGDALVDVLVAEGILHDAGRADWYPCGGYCGEDRPVLRRRSKPDQPYYAPCKIGDGCPGESLQESDLPLFRHSFSRFIDVLWVQLGITPSPNPELAISRGIHRLGTIARDGLASDVFLAVEVAPTDHFPQFLATRAPIARRSWVLASTLRWVPDLLQSAHGPGAHVEVCGLSDLLELRDDRIKRVGQPESIGASSSTAPRPRPAAMLLTKDGTRALGAVEYQEVVENAADRFDLFLDVATERQTGRRRFCVGGYRDEKGRYREVEIPSVDARGVADFIDRARDAFVLPEELPALRQHDAVDKFRRGWAKIDPGRRSIAKEKLTYRFQPPPGVRWAVVRAVDANEPTKQGG